MISDATAIMIDVFQDPQTAVLHFPLVVLQTAIVAHRTYVVYGSNAARISCVELTQQRRAATAPTYSPCLSRT